MEVYIKIENTIVKLGDIEIEKQKFHQYKRPISIQNKWSLSIKGFKYLIGYEDA